MLVSGAMGHFLESVHLQGTLSSEVCCVMAPAWRHDPARKLGGGLDAPSIPPCVSAPEQGGVLCARSSVHRDMVVAGFDEYFNMSTEQTELWMLFTFDTPGFCWTSHFGV